MYAALTLIALMLVQAGANLLDAHLEYERGRRSRWDVVVTDSTPRATDEVLARQGLGVLRVGFALIALGICAGLALVTAGGTLELALGAFGLAVAFLYASTTYALKRLPGGELVVFVALGPAIVAATVLAQRQHVTTSEFLLGCALGLFGTAAVEVVRLRDATQPPVLGASLAPDRSARALPRIVFAVCVVGAYAILIVAAVRDVGVVGAAAALLSFPAALRALGVGVRTNSAVVLESLARQALHAYMWFALLLVAGALCGAVTWALLR
jgi:1,4-dihydroxy-2-naphthoate octaprenyltransferase